MSDRLGEVHDLKCWQPFFDDVVSGAKPFEVRRDDRGYRVGDVLHLREWTGTGYSGRACLRTITYILSNGEMFGMRPNYVVMALSAAVPESSDDAR